MADEATTNEIDPTSPRSVTFDGQTVWAHSLEEQMEAADRAEAKKVTAKRRLGIRFSRMRPGDAV